MTVKTMTSLDTGALMRIHQDSLKVLEQVGFRVGDAECLKILKKAGANVDDQIDEVRLPASMVVEALDEVTKRFSLVAPGGDCFSLPGERPRLISRVKMPKILDYGATRARPPTERDVINLCQLTNSLSEVDFSYAVDFPSSDVPAEIDVLNTVGLTYAITGNPAVCAPVDEKAGRAWLDIAAIAGTGDLKESPGVLVAVCTTGPLRLEAEMGRLFRHVVERGAPVAAEPMPMAGASAPFTLAGVLLLDNAETLFLLTLANAIRPGAKVTYSALGSIMNMRSANLSMGAPETMLLSSAETALARFYGLSTYRPACYSDSLYSDIQAGIEKTAFTLMVTMSGADLVLMGGSLDNASTLSYEQVVLDHDIWEFANRCIREIEVNDETLALDTVAQVGIGGSYLDEEHTLDWLRSGEHYYGGSFNRSGQPGEEKTMLTRAHQRVEDILSQPVEFQAPGRAVERIKEYVRDEARSLGVNPPGWCL